MINTVKWLWDANFIREVGKLYAFMGDMEAFFWAMKKRRDLLPPVTRQAQELYFNRQNGVFVTYENTTYYPPGTNWTTFEDEEIQFDPDTESTP